MLEETPLDVDVLKKEIGVGKGIQADTGNSKFVQTDLDAKTLLEEKAAHLKEKLSGLFSLHQQQQKTRSSPARTSTLEDSTAMSASILRWDSARCGQGMAPGATSWSGHGQTAQQR